MFMFVSATFYKARADEQRPGILKQFVQMQVHCTLVMEAAHIPGEGSTGEKYLLDYLRQR